MALAIKYNYIFLVEKKSMKIVEKFNYRMLEGYKTKSSEVILRIKKRKKELRIQS